MQRHGFLQQRVYVQPTRTSFGAVGNRSWLFWRRDSWDKAYFVLRSTMAYLVCSSFDARYDHVASNATHALSFNVFLCMGPLSMTIAWYLLLVNNVLLGTVVRLVVSFRQSIQRSALSPTRAIVTNMFFLQHHVMSGLSYGSYAKRQQQ